MKKTIKVEELKNQLNEMLAHSSTAPDFRLGLCAAVEVLLHSTGNYKGFKYIDFEPGSSDFTMKMVRDDSRRFYF
jgi:hypothetical protein